MCTPACEKLIPEFYRAECSCSAKYDPLGLYIEPDASGEFVFFSVSFWENSISVPLLICRGIWEQRQKRELGSAPSER